MFSSGKMSLRIHWAVITPSHHSYVTEVFKSCLGKFAPFYPHLNFSLLEQTGLLAYARPYCVTINK